MRLPPVFAGREVLGGSVAAALFRVGLWLPSGTTMRGYLAPVTEVVGAVRR